MNDLEATIVDHIGRVGPIGFDEYVDHALYTPGLGFYTSGRGAGRRRDFLTSPEVGPLFGAVVATALDRWWDELGRPDPYHVVEAGAGPGTLARAVLAAAPRCAGALRLVLVEEADVQWATHPPAATSRRDLPAPGELG
ncbi:MAG TPA: SAM-dependent methyltransferase, partial [Aquihabitans sp.]|nr:SAM-dependent methyltransferase [Aquihabitans sp.]